MKGGQKETRQNKWQWVIKSWSEKKKMNERREKVFKGQ